MAWIKCDSGRSFVQAEQITKIWGNFKENPVMGFTGVKSTITITALDSGNEESVIYCIEIDYGTFDNKKDTKLNCEEAEKNWETEVIRQTDEYMKEILIEITKQIDAAIKTKEHQILDFSTMKLR